MIIINTGILQHPNFTGISCYLTDTTYKQVLVSAKQETSAKVKAMLKEINKDLNIRE